jgi:YVTN family beta-propeller protein
VKSYHSSLCNAALLAWETMKRSVFGILLMLALGLTAQNVVQRFVMKHRSTGKMIAVPSREGADALLVSGWKTTPAGRHVQSGDMILSGAFSPDGKLFAYTNTGYGRHQLHIVDVGTEKETHTFPMEQGWSGLAWGADGKRIYVSSGAGYAGAPILTFDYWDKEGWQEARGGLNLYGATREATAVSSLVHSHSGKVLYAVNNSDGYVYLLDTHSGRSISRVQAGDHPLTALLSADGRTLYVANLGGSEVAVIDVADAASPKVQKKFATGPHPNDLAVSKDGKTLYVSCGNTNSVYTIDLATGQTLEQISLAPGTKAPAGSTPNSLSLSPDGEYLYVASADNNTVAVVEVEERGKSTQLPAPWQ